MRRERASRLARASIAVVLLALWFATAPAATALRLTAREAVVVDARSGKILYARRPDAHAPVASTTKLMTALLTLERLRPSQRVSSPGYVGGPQEVTIGLARGERMTVNDLLRALLLPSANDAAVTLAHAVAGSVHAFVAEMNVRAATLGLVDTHYANPIGLDAPGNYSSADDLARLAAHLLANPIFAHIVDLPAARLASGSHPRTVVNRNVLVARYPFVRGVKTGHTTDAGYVLVGAGAARGAEVVSAVLGEPDERSQDADTLTLLRFGLSRFTNLRPLARGTAVARARVRYWGSARVPLVASRAVTLVAPSDASVVLRVQAPRRLTGPLPAGRRVGSVTVVDDGMPAATVALVTGAPVKGAGLLRRLWPLGDAGLAALAFLALGAGVVSWRLVRAGREARGERASG